MQCLCQRGHFKNQCHQQADQKQEHATHRHRLHPSSPLASCVSPPADTRASSNSRPSASGDRVSRHLSGSCVTTGSRPSANTNKKCRLRSSTEAGATITVAKGRSEEHTSEL